MAQDAPPYTFVAKNGRVAWDTVLNFNVQPFFDGSNVSPRDLEALDEVARRVRGNSKPFGGLQLILCGDFYQLPPVTKGGTAPRFAFEARCWPSVVRRCFELHKVFRQSDPEFIDALAQVRVGRCSAAAEAMLRACRGRPLPDFDGISATRLFTHKDDCNRLNEQRLRALPGAAVTFRARDSGRDEAALSARFLEGVSAMPHVRLLGKRRVVPAEVPGNAAGNLSPTATTHTRALPGAEDAGNTADRPSWTTSWNNLHALNPERLVIAPCGFPAARTAADKRDEALLPFLGVT